MSLCTGHTKSGRPCANHPMHGQSVCEKHGGKTPAALVKGEERQALTRAQQALARLGVAEARGDPIRVLEQTLGEAVALQEALRDLVVDLKSIRYESEKGDEQIRGELQAYLSLLARTESIAGKMLSLRLEERRLALDEALGALVADCVFGLLQDLKLNNDQAAIASARKRLEAIEVTSA